MWCSQLTDKAFFWLQRLFNGCINEQPKASRWISQVEWSKTVPYEISPFPRRTNLIDFPQDFLDDFPDASHDDSDKLIWIIYSNIELLIFTSRSLEICFKTACHYWLKRRRLGKIGRSSSVEFQSKQVASAIPVAWHHRTKPRYNFGEK